MQPSLIKVAAWPQAGKQSCQAASAASTNFIPVAMSTHIRLPDGSQSLAINAKILTVVYQMPDVIFRITPCERNVAPVLSSHIVSVRHYNSEHC